MFAAEI